MLNTYIKPDLSVYFIAMPLIGMYLNADYNKANTVEEITNLVHKWLDVSETTTNEVKKYWYQISAQNLFSILTRVSYETKII
jgi:hypothetical protein